MGVTILASRLRTARQRKELTQIEAGKLLGTSNANLSAYELGKREPDYGMLIKMARLYECSVDHLLGLVDNPTPYRDGVKNDAASDLVRYLESYPLTPDDVEAVKDLLEARRLRKEKDATTD